MRAPILPACSSLPRQRPPRSARSTSSAASSRPPSSCAGCALALPTPRRPARVPGPSPAGSRCPCRRARCSDCTREEAGKRHFRAPRRPSLSVARFPGSHSGPRGSDNHECLGPSHALPFHPPEPRRLTTDPTTRSRRNCDGFVPPPSGHWAGCDPGRSSFTCPCPMSLVGLRPNGRLARDHPLDRVVVHHRHDLAQHTLADAGRQ
jgi:hypothetical protein